MKKKFKIPENHNELLGKLEDLLNSQENEMYIEGMFSIIRKTGDIKLIEKAKRMIDNY